MSPIFWLAVVNGDFGSLLPSISTSERSEPTPCKSTWDSPCAGLPGAARHEPKEFTGRLRIKSAAELSPERSKSSRLKIITGKAPSISVRLMRLPVTEKRSSSSDSLKSVLESTLPPRFVYRTDKEPGCEDHFQILCEGFHENAEPRYRRSSGSSPLIRRVSVAVSEWVAGSICTLS